MGKTKPTDNIVSEKTTKKAKDLIQKIEAKQTEISKGKAPKKDTTNLNAASKKIKKEPIEVKKDNKTTEKKVVKQQNKKENAGKKPKLQAEKEPVKAVIESLNVNKYSEFVKTENAKYSKIRRRTIEVLKLDKYQVKKAAQALIAHIEKTKAGKNQLLDTNDDFIYLELILSEVPKQYSIRPIQIKMPAPIYGPQFQSRFCVFSTDPQRAFKDKIQDLDVPNIAKVIGYSKLVKEHPQYSDKRKLFYDYDLFFCDYKLYNLLRKPTGKIFYERKKIPFPIDCQEIPEHLKEEYKTYQDYLNSFADCTYFSMGNGPAYTVKVARVSMNIKDIVKNIIHGVYNTLPHILKEAIKHSKIRQISIKTENSISLPIFNQLTEEELKAVLDEAAEEENGKEAKGKEVKGKAAKGKAAKGKAAKVKDDESEMEEEDDDEDDE